VKTTSIGFYAINGVSVLRSVESLHKERIVEVFEAIREQNPTGRIPLVPDNFSVASQSPLYFASGSLNREVTCHGCFG